MLGFELLTIPSAITLANLLTCNPILSPKVNFEVVAQDPTFNKKEYIAKLETMNRITDFHFTGDQGKVPALHRITATTSQQLVFTGYDSTANNQACLYIARANIKIILEPSIYMAREISGNKCFTNKVVALKTRHIQEDVAFVESKEGKGVYFPSVREFIKKYLVTGPFPLGDQKSTDPDRRVAGKLIRQQKLKQFFSNTLATPTAELNKILVDRQQRVDIKDTYDALAAECDYEIPYETAPTVGKDENGNQKKAVGRVDEFGFDEEGNYIGLPDVPAGE